MFDRLSHGTILPSAISCCFAIASTGCTPPAPSDVKQPISAGSTSTWISPAVASVAEFPAAQEPKMEDPENRPGQFPVQKTDDEWKALLTPEQFRITRLKGTERAFTGIYWNTKTAGMYQCVCCGRDLFVSNAKFESGCGWPSFFQAVDDKAITTQTDYSIPPPRVEIMCSNCGAHLGHVFKDGPPPTGLRFCVNSASVKLVESGEKQSDSGQNDE